MESSLWLTCLQTPGFQSMWVRSGRASGMCLRSPRRRAEGSWLRPASSRGQPAPSQLLVGFGCSSWCRRCLCAVWGVLGLGLDLRGYWQQQIRVTPFPRPPSRGRCVGSSPGLSSSLSWGRAAAVCIGQHLLSSTWCRWLQCCSWCPFICAHLAWALLSFNGAQQQLDPWQGLHRQLQHVSSSWAHPVGFPMERVLLRASVSPVCSCLSEHQDPSLCTTHPSR